MRKLTIALLLSLIALPVLAQHTHVYPDLQHKTRKIPIEEYQLTTAQMRCHLLEDGAQYILAATNGWGAKFEYFRNVDSMGVHTVAGTVNTGTNQVDFSFAKTNLAAHGEYIGRLTLTNSTKTLTWGNFAFSVKKNPPTGSSTPLVLTTPISWSAINMLDALTMTADLNMGGFAITNMAAMQENLDMGGFSIINLATDSLTFNNGESLTVGSTGFVLSDPLDMNGHDIVGVQDIWLADSVLGAPAFIGYAASDLGKGRIRVQARGGFADFFGTNTSITAADRGDVVIQAGSVAGADVRLMDRTSGQQLSIDENGVTLGTLAANWNAGGYSITNLGSLITTGSVTIAGLLTLGNGVTFSAGSGLVSMDTADGADSSLLTLGGGGAATTARGATLYLYGNEHGSQGAAILAGGIGAGADVILQAGGENRFRVFTNGLLSTLGGSLALAGGQLTGVANIADTNGNLVVGVGHVVAGTANLIGGAGNIISGASSTRNVMWSQGQNLDGTVTDSVLLGDGDGWTDLDHVFGFHWEDTYTNDACHLGGSNGVFIAGALDAGGNKLVDVADPTAAQDAATKNYVDSLESTYGEIGIRDGAITNDLTTGFSVITGLVVYADEGDVTVSVTNMLIGTAGDYEFEMAASMEKVGAGTDVFDLHVFTNGVDTGIGWTRSVSVQAAQGAAAGSGILSLGAGADVTFRHRVLAATETIVYEHLSIIMCRKK